MFTEEVIREISTEWPEIQVFYAIRELGSFIFHMNHDMADGRIPLAHHKDVSEDVERARENTKAIVPSLTRFGVKVPSNENGGPTPEYWRWYQWWDSYERSLTSEQFDELNDLLSKKQDVSSWRAKVDWKTDLEVRSDLLEKHLQQYPQWERVLKTVLEENIFIVFPAEYVNIFSDPNSEANLVVYEQGVKGEQAEFRIDGDRVKCTNYPGSHKSTNVDEFLEMIRKWIAIQPLNDQTLIKLLTKS